MGRAEKQFQNTLGGEKVANALTDEVSDKQLQKRLKQVVVGYANRLAFRHAYKMSLPNKDGEKYRGKALYQSGDGFVTRLVSHDRKGEYPIPWEAGSKQVEAKPVDGI